MAFKKRDLPIVFVLLMVLFWGCRDRSDSCSDVSPIALKDYKPLQMQDTVRSLLSKDRMLFNLNPVSCDGILPGKNKIDSADKNCISASGESIISFSKTNKLTFVEKKALPLHDVTSYNLTSNLTITQEKTTVPASSGSYIIHLNAAVQSIWWASDSAFILKVHPIKKLTRLNDTTYSEQIDTEKTYYLKALLKPLVSKN